MASVLRSPHQFYGRRRVWRLRPARKNLLNVLLPELEIVTNGEILNLSTLFIPSKENFWLEIGFGGGEHIVAQALTNPKVGFIGCDPFINGVARLLGEINKNALSNIRIFSDDACRLLDWIPEASIDRVFLLFPDPWPKKRHAKRRFIQERNLTTLARIMCDFAELRVVSDAAEYIQWTLGYVLSHRDFEWMRNSDGDWSNRPPDWPMTRYEKKAILEGKQCGYLSFRRRYRCLSGACN